LLRIVGVTVNLSLDWKTFWNVLAVYRVTEGFSKSERAAMEVLYNKFCETYPVSGHSTLTRTQVSMGMKEAPKMQLVGLANLLLEYFGYIVVDEIPKVVEHANARKETVGANNASGFITFLEFLAWARILKDGCYNSIADQFGLVDQDDDEAISRDELTQLLQMLGFTVFQSALAEMVDEADIDEFGGICLDDVLSVCRVCNRRAGFRTQELKDLIAVFQLHDFDGSGHIETDELVPLLRHFGYSTSAEDVHRFLKKADANGDGTMDQQEFLRAMRLHSESDLKHVQEIFKQHSTELVCEDAGVTWSDVLHVKKLEVALTEVLEDEVRHDLVLELAKEADAPEAFTFEAFADVAAKCRKAKAEEIRKRAGFAEKDFDAAKKTLRPSSQAGLQGIGEGRAAVSAHGPWH
jgi:calmodulin